MKGNDVLIENYPYPPYTRLAKTVTCAETLFNDSRLCPACETSLPDSDDIVYTSLNPSQSFKSTILAGMNPNVVNDICGRALGFWVYQVTQEANFQQMILKDAQERLSTMETKVNNVLREANAELNTMRKKIQDLQAELQQTTRKNRELAETNRDSAKEYTKLKNQYEKMMGRSMTASMGKVGYAQVGGSEVPYSSTGNHQIGATPSRPFHPAPQMSSNMPQRRTLLLEQNNRPVQVINSAVNMSRARSNHSNGSSNKSGTTQMLDDSSLHARRPAAPVATSAMYRNSNLDNQLRHPVNQSHGNSVSNTASFKFPLSNVGSRGPGMQPVDRR